MFKLDMNAIRQNATTVRLMANSANSANDVDANSSSDEIRSEISPKPDELATLAAIAISHDVSQESAEMLAARLIAAAMRVCDLHGDSEQARAEMRQDIEATPPHLRADLLDHFQSQLPALTQQRPWLSIQRISVKDKP